MRYRLWWVLVGGMLLGACAGMPGRGVPSHYAQDSLSTRCLQNPLYCATATGREIGTGPAQTVGTAAASAAAVWKLWDDAAKHSIKRALELCANTARTEVLLRHSGTFKSPVPDAGECKSLTVVEGRSVTWAMRLGLEMHGEALRCAERELNRIRPGGFSLKPRYRFNRKTGAKSLISPEEKADLLRQGGEGLKGTLEPDVVIHTGNPLLVRAVFDFKFRCVDFGKEPDWRDYPAGHRYAGESQGKIYKEAFGDVVELIGPRKGVFW